MKKTLKIISVILTICMMFGIISMVATAQSAAQMPTLTANVSDCEIVKELVAERTENTKTFLMSDGSKTVAAYDQPIHFLDENDTWQDIDNTMTSVGDEYMTVDSNIESSVKKTLSDGMSVSVSANGHDISWGYLNVNDSKAAVINESSSQNTDNHLDLTDLTSKVLYSDVFESVDAEYIVTPTGVKENIILKDKSAQNEFLLKYNYSGLSVSQISDKTICLKSGNDVIYTISAPVMTDNDGQISDDLRFDIISKSDDELVLKLTAERSFLNNAKYPVSIDPNLEIKSASDISVSRYNTSTGSDYDYIYSGDVPGQKNYVILGVNGQPKIPLGAVVKSANLYLPFSYFAGNFEIYKLDAPISGNLSSSVFNSSLSEYPFDVYDASNAGISGTAKFNITSSAQDLLTDSYMSFAVDTGENSYYPNFTTSTMPSISIRYEDRSGINDKYSYHTQEVDGAGTVYVNDLTQKNTILRNDFSISSDILPMSAAMIYARKYSKTSYDKYAWRSIYNQTITVLGSGDDTEYIWENENGEIVYFITKQTDSDNVAYYSDSADLGYKYYPSDKKIVSENDDIFLFESAGSSKLRLCALSAKYYEQKDDSGNVTYSSKAVITYSSSLVIDTVTDGDGNIYKYSGSGVSVYSKDDASLSNAKDSVEYSYSSGLLSSVTYNGKTSHYEYSTIGSNSVLKRVVSYNGTGVEYEYNAALSVTKITEIAKNGDEYILGNSLSVSHKNGKTEFCDENGNKEIYVFDDNANLITIMNQDGLAINKKSDKKGNLLGSTDVTVTSVNLVNNSSFESGLSGWQSVFTESTSDKSYSGLKSAKTTGDAFIKRDVSVNPGKTYSFSAYAFTQSIGENGYSVLSVSYTDSNGKEHIRTGKKLEQNSTDWQRASISVNVPSGVNSVEIKIETNADSGDGVAYYDAVQLEEHKAAYDYNIIENSDFASSSGWDFNNASIVENDTLHGGLDSKVAKLVGNGSNSSYISTDVAINGTKDMQFTLSAWINANGIKNESLGSDKYRFAKIAVYQYSGDSVVDSSEIDIPASIQNNWYKIADTITLGQNCDKLRIRVHYENQYSILLVDGLSLGLGGFAEPETEEKDETPEISESNDQDGNRVVTETYSDGSKTVTVYGTEIKTVTEYDSDNSVISITKYNSDDKEIYYESDGKFSQFSYSEAGDVLEITRDKQTFHELTRVITDSLGRETSRKDSTTGITNRYTYDGESENTTSESTTADGVTLKTFTAYSKDSNGNSVTASTDFAGRVTTTVADAISGLNLSTTDGKGNVTSYAYDSLQNLTSMLSNSTDIQTDYTYYPNGSIKSITSNSKGTSHIVYNFTYEPFGNISEIKAGNTTLVTYNYDNITHNPLTISYANGNIITYTYDSLGALVKESCGSTFDVRYTYTEVGSVYEQSDMILGTVTVVVDGETEVWSSGYSKLLSANSSTENSTSETVGDNHYLTKYSSTDQTKDTQKTDAVTFGNMTQTTYTDKFGRVSKVVTKHGETETERREYSYVSRTENGETLSSDLVASVTTTVGSSQTTDSYLYDDNGNITKIKRNGQPLYEYQYDSLGQLTDEYDFSTHVKTTYYYDSLGNIRSAVRFSFTVESTGEYNFTFQKAESYSYDDDNRADKLTSGSFGAVDYDALGNPTSLKGYTLNWKNGRQLGSISKGGKVTSYSYNSDGLRTKRTVDGVDYDYTWRDGLLTHQKQGNNELHFFYDSKSSIIGFTLNGGAYTYLKNLQGDVIGIVDGNGNKLAEYSYDSWGNIISQSGPLSYINPIRYKGYYYDSDTGMYYLQSRYYDPALRRFINADDQTMIPGLSINSLFGCNLFIYCNNSGILNSDQNGYSNASIILNIVSIVFSIFCLFSGFAWFKVVAGVALAVASVIITNRDYNNEVDRIKKLRKRNKISESKKNSMLKIAKFWRNLGYVGAAITLICAIAGMPFKRFMKSTIVAVINALGFARGFVISTTSLINDIVSATNHKKPSYY